MLVHLISYGQWWVGKKSLWSLTIVSLKCCVNLSWKPKSPDNKRERESGLFSFRTIPFSLSWHKELRRRHYKAPVKSNRVVAILAAAAVVVVYPWLYFKLPSIESGFNLSFELFPPFARKVIVKAHFD